MGKQLLSATLLLCLAGASPQAVMATAPEQTNQQQKQRIITGTVVGVDKEPIIGANVIVKNTTIGTVTDIDGKFTISMTGAKPVLQISYIGFKTKEVTVGTNSNYNIELEPDDAMLDEVVIVGGGMVQKKVSVTGSITTVKADQLKVPTTNLSNAFAGRIAGVIAKQTSGEPGSGSEFYIRGISTFGGRTTPLILLDDVEISTADLNYVPAENIESFSILKDASATAIYGARGANGVMIITTKGGEYNQKTKVNVTAENSFNFIDKFPQFVDGAQYMQLYNEASIARGGSARYSDLDIDRTASGYNPYLYPNVNWQDVMFQDMSMRQKVNVNVSGGGQKVKYFMSLEVNHDSGLLNTEKAYSWNNNINIMNYTFQNNIAYKLTPTTTIRMNMNAQIRQNKGPNASTSTLFNNILTTTPILFPVTYPTKEGVEHIMYGNNYITGSVRYVNPYAQMMTSYKEQNQNTLNTVVKIEQDLGFITKGLNFNAWVNFKNWSSSYYTRSINPYYYRVQANSYDADDPNTDYELELLNTDGTDYISQSDITKSSDQTFELQANLNYNRQFGEHNVGAMLLYKQREYRSSVLPNRNQGLSGRATYDYGGRYLAEFNFGYNGTERLAKEDRFGLFPAASIGWVVSNEQFFAPLSSWVDNFKLRASYGLVGSDDLAQPDGSYYLYIDKITGNNLSYLTWTSGQDMNLTLGGPELAYYAQPGLSWEKVKKLNVGLDLTVFRNWSFTFDYFKDKRFDIFMKREAWPQSLGYDTAKPWSNVGKMENRGFEFSANYAGSIGKDWAFSLQGNFTYNENKVTYKDEPIYPTSWKMELNKPLNPTWGWISEGLFTSQEEIDNSPDQSYFGQNTIMVGDIKYRDINGDGVINADDQIMISKYNSTPRLQYGFGGTLNWKKLSLGVFFTGSALRTIMTNGMDPFQEGIGVGNRNVIQYIADDYFSEAKMNFDAKYPRLGLTTKDISNNQVNSTYWMRNGSFLRLKNVELGYEIPYGRIYVSGANLLTFSPFDLWDPELSGWNSYPLQKTVNVGIQISF
jgi:TonB-linked SusC/RagA family outer membrane protein